MMRKIISFLLALTLCAGLVPAGALAAAEEPPAEDAYIDSQPEVTGTSSVGGLLENTMETYTEQTEGSACNVTDITVDGAAASVTFHTDRAADVVAALYTEDGMKMTASGTAAVSAGEETVTIALTVSQAETYFIAAAYLLDAESREPLCEAYVSRYYTREFQEFLAKDINDFDPNLTLNLDEQTDTNFVVFGADTLMASASDAANQITDNGNGTYTITNADESFQNLKIGDTFSYTYDDGTVLVVKAAAVSVSGTTVTVTEDAAAELADVFDYVRIDATSDGATVTRDTSTMDEGVSLAGSEQAYDDTVSEDAANALLDTGGTHTISDNYTIEKEIGPVTLTGIVGYKIDVILKAYVSMSWSYISLQLDTTLTFTVSASAATGEKALSLPRVYAELLPGVSIGFTPSFIVDASAEITWTSEIHAMFGFAYDSDAGWQNLSTAPTPSSKVEFNGRLYVGIRLTPDIVIVNENLARASLVANVGLEVNVHFTTEKPSGYIHDCALCYDGDINCLMNVTAKINLLKGTVDKSKELLSRTWPLAVFYWSWDYNEFAFTTCPHKRYQLDVTAKDISDTIVDIDDITVTNQKTGDSYTMEAFSRGEDYISVYLPNGTYNVTARSGAMKAEKEVTIHDEKKAIKLKLMDTDTYGECGKNLIWSLKDGVLTISGTGTMKDYKAGKAPWYDRRSEITSAVITSGVTGVGDYAFSGCENLALITFEGDAPGIKANAFDGVTARACYHAAASGWTEDIMQSYGGTLTWGCIEEIIASGSCGDNLTWTLTGGGVLTISGTGEMKDYSYSPSAPWHDQRNNIMTVIIENGVTGIGNFAFYNCSSLTSVTIPDSVTSIGERAFRSCSSLTSVTIPDSVTSIEFYAFDNCDSLTAVYISSIESWCGITFDNSYANPLDCAGNLYLNGELVTDLVIPDSVTSIGKYAFWSCDSLTSVTIPDSVTSIGGSAFRWCTSLTSVAIGNSVTSIGNHAFSGCSSLASVTIPNSVTSIGDYAFWLCESLTDVYYAGSEEDWAAIDFYTCNSDLTSAAIHYNSTGAANGAAAGAVAEPEVTPEPAAETTPTTEVTPEPAVEPTLALEPTVEPTPTPTPEPTPEPTVEPEPEVAAEPVPEAEMTPEPVAEAEPVAESLAAYAGSVTADGTQSVASFGGLVPGERYVMLVTADGDGDPLAPENLLYIIQGAADGSGAVSFSYIPREDVSGASAAVYGLSGRNLADGAVTVDGRGNALVSYGGELLLEDRDFTVRYTAAAGSKRVVTVTGKVDYAGSNSVTIQLGDANGDGAVSAADAMTVARHAVGLIALSGKDYYAAEVSGDYTLSAVDAMLAAYYAAGALTAFPVEG